MKNKFNTNIGEFTIVRVLAGSEELIRDNVSCLAGWDFENKTLYISDIVNGYHEGSIIEAFSKAVNEGSLI